MEQKDGNSWNNPFNAAALSIKKPSKVHQISFRKSYMVKSIYCKLLRNLKLIRMGYRYEGDGCQLRPIKRKVYKRNELYKGRSIDRDHKRLNTLK